MLSDDKPLQERSCTSLANLSEASEATSFDEPSFASLTGTDEQ